MVEWSKDMYVNPNLQANLGKCLLDSKYVNNAWKGGHPHNYNHCVCVCVCGLFAGQEHPSDSDGGELKLPDQLVGRRDSISSLDSTVSSSVPVSQADHPEQYEVIKQQKDIIEHGIEL